MDSRVNQVKKIKSSLGWICNFLLLFLLQLRRFKAHQDFNVKVLQDHQGFKTSMLLTANPGFKSSRLFKLHQGPSRLQGVLLLRLILVVLCCFAVWILEVVVVAAWL